MAAKRAKTIRHTLTLRGFDSRTGKISLLLLTKLSEHITRLSESTLLSFVEGNSTIKRGRQAEWLSKSLDFQLSGIKAGSTVLEVEAPILEYTLPPIQIPIFVNSILDDIVKTSALGLGMIAFNQVLSGNLDSPLLDKYLLREMRDFGEFLDKKDASIEFNAGKSTKQLKLKHDSIEKIKSIEEKTPRSIRTNLTGTLDMLKHSNNQLELIVAGDKRIRAILSDDLKVSQLTDFFGHSLTVTGMAHYNPLGDITSLELTGFKKADKKATYFEQAPKPLFEETDIKRISESQKYKGYNADKVKDAVSEMEIDQSLEELLNALK